eukprot:CAMPEP_0115888574 /NCGR_PEP_ID=MMETSP0287-20121206/32375_1 /TAXON_ID=412157 /ORGANISM="Chrysochromulina rotalis, Strain UIO044" /LENGTH=270 /DNA_ID=CAMNT_0003345257 /DNA_START=78 /DNA_END=887 /DNA_ORIENTATION=-
MRYKLYSAADAEQILSAIQVLGQATRHVHVLLEVLPEGTYRVWNSEGWATHAFPRFERSPLSGPVGRGTFPVAASSVAWTAAPTEPVLLEMDTTQNTYRTLRVDVLDLETLEAGTTRQPPLGLTVLTEGSLDIPSACDHATTRAACAALGGPCGWCEQVDGIHASHCTAGGPDRACIEECAAWHFFDTVPPAGPFPAPPPPPSPPGLTEEDLVRLEAHSREAAIWLETTGVGGVEAEDAGRAVAPPPYGPIWGVGGHRLQRMMSSFGQHV